jgi:Ca-activated chloride channel family protein
VVVDRDGDYRARVGYEERNVLPDQDFELVYTVSPEDVGLNLLSYKDGDADGFFLMLVAPQVEVDRRQVVDKDVLLILDTSGSMEGEKLEQAKESLIFVLEHLNEGDRFNITDFSTGVRQYARNPQPASQRGEAAAWVRGLSAGGGTDINRALLETLASVDPERPTILIFLTDGQPTEGEVETDRIMANFANATVRLSSPKSRPNVRLFTFGVGDDVNTILLDTLAQEQRGASGYVRPGQRIDEEVSAFYAKVSTPLLADIAIEVEGVHIEDMYPYPLPDLFAGTQLVVVGRYRDGGPSLIRLTGQVNAQGQQFTYEGYFERAGGDRPGERDASSFIPRLWATRKIGYLLNQIRLHGESRELVDEIVELSIRYGIVTPYTSYLVQEDADVLTREGRQSIADEEYKLQSAAPAAEAGAEAVEKAVEQEAIRGADRAEAPAGEAAEVVKIVSDKTFIHRDGLWTDTTFDPSRMTTQKVGFGSETYFSLLAARPDMGVYFALGDRVIVVVDGVAYEVAEGDSGPITLPPTPASGTPAGATPTPRPVASNTTQPTPTPRPTGSDTQPTPRAGQDESNRTGPSSFCPGIALTGLVLLPLAGFGMYRRKGK